MQANNETPGLEKLPRDLLATILNFMDGQEKINSIQVLRVVCKNLRTTINAKGFLKNGVKSYILYAKRKGLDSILDKNQVLQNQIKDWQALKLKLVDTYNSFYTTLPQIKEVINLINQIKQTSVPKISYMTAFRMTYLRPKVLLVLAILLILTLASVNYSANKIINISPLITQKSKLERELIAEGCTIERGSHGSSAILNCKDTIKADQWQSLHDEILVGLTGPIVLNTVFGISFIVVIFVFFVNCMQLKNNQADTYEDLGSAHLYPVHHVLLTNIRNKFPNFNPMTPNIRDIRVGLEKLLSDKDLPTDIYDPKIKTLSNEYLGFINTLNSELTKLGEYQKNKELVMSTELSSGEPKATFRKNVYTFFSECQELKKQQLSPSIINLKEERQALTHRLRRNKVEKVNEEIVVLSSQNSSDESTEFYANDSLRMSTNV